MTNAADIAHALWSSAVAAPGTPVATYLESRNFTAPIPPTIRFLPEAKHSITGLYLPCMLAAMTRWPGREVIGVHRTFLLPDGRGKARVPSPKMALGSCAGNAVRMAAADDTLALCEGIETALSCQQMYGDPIWAACGSNLAGVVVPDSVKRIIIYADNGNAGERAAKKAAAHFHGQGRSVTIVRPIDGYDDFNTYLQALAGSDAA